MLPTRRRRVLSFRKHPAAEELTWRTLNMARELLGGRFVASWRIVGSVGDAPVIEG